MVDKPIHKFMLSLLGNTDRILNFLEVATGAEKVLHDNVVLKEYRSI